jgi:7,8-dihydropterin-6-yl-methyl-4-(beta-D-ribofuranosyl)aminobenzene 5'-phosphate synthase
MAAIGEEPAIVSELKITTLSTMLTEFRGVGEWGYAALIEADGHTLLFDTGERPDTVLKNAVELGIDLSTVDTVILTHNHFDHTGGLAD